MSDTPTPLDLDACLAQGHASVEEAEQHEAWLQRYHSWEARVSLLLPEIKRTGLVDRSQFPKWLTTKGIAYAYPSSPQARELGFEGAGCWYLCIYSGGQPGKAIPVTASVTLAEVEPFALRNSLPWHPIHVQYPPKGASPELLTNLECGS